MGVSFILSYRNMIQWVMTLGMVFSMSVSIMSVSLTSQTSQAWGEENPPLYQSKVCSKVISALNKPLQTFKSSKNMILLLTASGSIAVGISYLSALYPKMTFAFLIIYQEFIFPFVYQLKAPYLEKFVPVVRPIIYSLSENTPLFPIKQTMKDTLSRIYNLLQRLTLSEQQAISVATQISTSTTSKCHFCLQLKLSDKEELALKIMALYLHQLFNLYGNDFVIEVNSATHFSTEIQAVFPQINELTGRMTELVAQEIRENPKTGASEFTHFDSTEFTRFLEQLLNGLRSSR